MPNPLTFPCTYKRNCGTQTGFNYTSEGSEEGRPYRSVVFPDPPPLPDTIYYAMGCLYMCTSYNSQEEADACAASQEPLCEPPPPGSFIAYGCSYPCISYISQEDADACAAAQSADCVVNPPSPDQYVSPSCMGPCTSFTSQEDADLCAMRNSVLCYLLTPQYSAQGMCTVVCSNGTTFTYIVAAGAFVASTQQAANFQANQYACKKAVEKKICLGDIETECCANGSYASAISHNRPVSAWSVVGGSLPLGIALTDEGILIGTPTIAGAYSFTIRAYDSDGNYAQRTYTLGVVGITNDNFLPAGDTGVAYDLQLTADGGSGNYRYVLTSGSLPPGLTMGTDGHIQGTPTTGGDYAFTISVESV